jgi:hypothetical protein
LLVVFTRFSSEPSPTTIVGMIRGLSILLAALGAISGVVFIAMVLGGYPAALAHERAALAPLMAGLGCGILEGYRRKAISNRAAAILMVLLAVWAGFLRFS